MANFFTKLLGLDNKDAEKKKREEELARARQGIKPNQSIFNKLRDVVDPNTAADVSRRVQQGKQASYVSDVKGVGGIAKGLGKSIFEVGDTAVQGTRYGAGLLTNNRMARDSAARQLRDSASQTIVNQIYRPAEDMTINALYKYPRAAIEAGNVLRGDWSARLEQAAKKQGLTGNYLRDVVAPSAETATNVLGLGQASALGAGFKTAVTEGGLKSAARQAIPSLAETQAYNAIQGGAQELYKQDPTLAGAGKSAAVGAVAGTAGDIALAGIPGYISAKKAVGIAESPVVKSKAMSYLEQTTPDPKIKTAVQPPQPNIKRIPDAPLKPGSKFNPQDSEEAIRFIDSQRGATKLSKNQKLNAEIDARALAERYGYPSDLPPAKLANYLDNVLQEQGYKPSVLKKVNYYAEDTGLRDRAKSISNEDLMKQYGDSTDQPTFKKSQFEQSVLGAQEISPELKKQVKASTPMYEAVTNKKQLAKSEELVKKGISQATVDVKDRLATKLGTIDNQTVSDTIAVIKRLDSKGTKKAFQESAELTEQLSLHLTKAGQTVQAASLLSNTSPDGILFRARKQLHQAGVEITPEIQVKLKQARDAIESKPMGSEARNYEIAKMLKITAGEIPSSAGDKLTTLWKAGLLTGIKTQTGNTLSGAASLGLKKVSDVPTAAIDQIAALFTGKRSKALTLEGLGSGGKEGLVKGARYLKTGVDERGMGFTKAKFDTKQVNFGKGPLGRAAQKYTDTVFGLMGAADQPLYFATLRNNLADLAIVEAKNQGLKGSVKDAFIRNFKKNPPEQAFQTATNAAEKATFANDTLLSKAAGGIRNSVKDSQVGSAAVNVLMPFTKVPSAVITRLFDYSPVGPVKLAVQQIQKGNVSQRALVEALGEATTGTGAMFLGYKLKEAGLMTGSYPEDPKERALWELEGKKPNSIKIGNTWVSVNYTSPLGQVLGTGAKAQEAVASGATGTDLVSQTVAGAGQTVIDQSFLQGVSGGLDALTDPERSAGKFIRGQVGSTIPTLSGDIAKAGDSKERQINSPIEAAQAKIPGLRQGLLPKTDALGNEINRPTGPVNTLLNPFRPSDIPNQPALNQELRRLQDAGFGVLAKDTTKFLQVGEGKDAIKVNLSPAELSKKNKEIGQAVQAQWNEIIASPEYQALSDGDKQGALDKAEKDIKAVKKLEILSQKNPEAASQIKLTKNQQRLADGGVMTASSYAKPSEGEGSGNTSEYYKANDAEYNDKKSEYERKVKSGEYTKAGKVKAEKELKKLEVGKDFSKDVRDLYSLSKADLADLLAGDPEGAKYAEQLIAYDKKLYEAGLITYRKFKNGIAPSKGKGGRGGNGGSKKSKNWLPTSTTSKFNASSSSSASRKLLANTIVKNTRKRKK